ncbi:MAG: hypothetical protein C0499_00035 [Zymomonas sp.]|nr:hypothetical protein [Zymomonas sp.]
MTEQMDTARLPWSRRLGWAVGDAGINFYWQGVGIFLYFFYTDVMGISPGWAGVAFAAASFWDAVSDPVVGAIADRTRSRFGRFRPWLLFASPPCALAFMLVFWVPPLVGGWLVAYAVATHIMFRTLLAAIGIPYNALSARMTQDSVERGTIAMLRMIFAAGGALATAFTMPKFVSLIDNPRHAYFWAATLLGAGATLILMAVFLSTREQAADDDTPPVARTAGLFRTVAEEVASFWAMLRYNGPLARMFAVVILGGITTALNGKILLYWVKYDLKEPAVMVWLLPLPGFVLLFVAPLWNWFAQITSKQAAWMSGAVLSATSLALFYLFNPHDHVLLIAITILGAAGGSAGVIMFWSMLPDTVEYNQWATGERAEARIFGLTTFGQKAALGINALMLGAMLTQVGFVANRPQSAETLAALRAIMCLIPLAGLLCSALVLWHYPITARFHAQLRRDIADGTRHAVKV